MARARGAASAIATPAPFRALISTAREAAAGERRGSEATSAKASSFDLSEAISAAALSGHPRMAHATMISADRSR